MTRRSDSIPFWVLGFIAAVLAALFFKVDRLEEVVVRIDTTVEMMKNAGTAFSSTREVDRFGDGG